MQILAVLTDNEIDKISGLSAEEIIKLYIKFNLDDTYLQLAIDKGFFDNRDDLTTFDLCRTYQLGEDVFQIAIDKGLFQYEESYSRLMLAAQAGSLKYVKQELLDCYIENPETDCTSIALMNSCEYGHLEVIKYLIDYGADVNYKDCDGYRPILKAAQNGHFDVIKLLVDLGADLNVKSKYSGLIVHAIKHYDVVKYLIEMGLSVHDDYPILHAAMTGNIDTVELLLSHGADINSQDEYCDSAILNALYTNNIQVMEFLITRGADLDLQYQNGNRLLSYAAKAGNLDIVKLLIESGADVSIKNNSGKSVLDIAISNNHHGVANYLIGHLSDKSE